MKIRMGVWVVLMVGSCSWAMAQAASNPVADTVRQMEESRSKNLIAAAEAMPPDKYSYKPTPEQMSFGHLVLHIAETNNTLCSKLGPEKQEVKFDGTESKDTLVRALRDSFDFCHKALEHANDSNLAEPMTLFGGHSGTRATALITLATSWADHYSAEAMYLRLNNLLPPTAAAKAK